MMSGKSLTCEVIVATIIVTAFMPVGAAEPTKDADDLSGQTESLRDELKAYKCKVLWESYRDGNWDLWIMNADGSDKRNLTGTKDVDEMYPKASPDGTKVCFVADEGKGKDKARSVYVMNIDGTDRKLVAQKGRWPCWSHDGKTIAYMKSRPGPYTTDHAATKGMVFCDLATGKHASHVNEQLERILCTSWSPDRKWFVCTASGVMGHGFAIVAFQADGVRNVGLLASSQGAWQCRPDFAPDGKHIAYAKARGTGPKDKIFSIETASVDLNAPEPKLSDRREVVTAGWPIELYHADWSPDGKYIVYSRGPREMNRMKPQRAIIAIQAPGWNICVTDAGRSETWVALTTDGLSNKEPDWVWVK
ncbi:MAG: PD40 domain-containing protein [Phycisphaerae bacterium]|nr:PD40 domain-containing protein [Phycisphaerae bacterium]